MSRGWEEWDAVGKADPAKEPEEESKGSVLVLVLCLSVIILGLTSAYLKGTKSTTPGRRSPGVVEGAPR